MVSPILTNLSSLVAFDENTVNATPQLLDADVTLVDAEGNFDGGTLTLTGVLAEDTVSVRHVGTGAGRMADRCWSGRIAPVRRLRGRRSR